jgi:hypothetical protein
MDAIIVDTEKTAKDCIQYLKEQVNTSICILFIILQIRIQIHIKADFMGLKNLQYGHAMTDGAVSYKHSVWVISDCALM